MPGSENNRSGLQPGSAYSMHPYHNIATTEPRRLGPLTGLPSRRDWLQDLFEGLGDHLPATVPRKVCTLVRAVLDIAGLLQG